MKMKKKKRKESRRARGVVCVLKFLVWSRNRKEMGLWMWTGALV